MAQGPRNGLVNQTVHVEICSHAFGVMELDAPLEDLAHLTELILALVIHAVREPIQDSSPDLVRQHRIKLVQLLTALHTRQLYVHPPEDEHIPQKQRRQFRTDFPDDGVFGIGRLVIVIAKPKRGAKKVHTPILLGRALHR